MQNYCYMLPTACSTPERWFYRVWPPKSVLCDRFFDATTAYQGYTRGLDVALIQKLHQLMLDNLTPDLTLLFDLPPKVGLSRAWKQINQKTRSAAETRFEEEAISFHEKVRAGYLSLARANPKRFSIINAAPGENQVRKAIIKTLKKMLNLWSILTLKTFPLFEISWLRRASPGPKAAGFWDLVNAIVIKSFMDHLRFSCS